MQADLFSAAALACTIQVPPAPELDIGRHQAWPFPGCTPRECAQAALARSSDYLDMLAAVVKNETYAAPAVSAIKRNATPSPATERGSFLEA